MTQHEKKDICSVCGCRLSENDRYVLGGDVLCGDCHMERTHPVAVCDPWPVLSAKKQLGAVKVDNSKLSDLQRSILDFIIKRGKATVEEMGMHFELPEFKIQNQIATLRHYELVKGKKEGSNVYIVPF